MRSLNPSPLTSPRPTTESPARWLLASPSITHPATRPPTSLRLKSS